eukprot:9438550-Pyramimonas_sp.AAC.1
MVDGPRVRKRVDYTMRTKLSRDDNDDDEYKAEEGEAEEGGRKEKKGKKEKKEKEEKVKDEPGPKRWADAELNRLEAA